MRGIKEKLIHVIVLWRHYTQENILGIGNKIFEHELYYVVSSVYITFREMDMLLKSLISLLFCQLDFINNHFSC